MYIDIISYLLSENCTKDHLREVAQKVFDDWMKLQDGFISWQICEDPNGQYTDIVCWDDQASAKKAETNMATMPHAEEWFGCYQPGSINSKSVNQVLDLKK